MGQIRNLLKVDALEYGGLDLTKPRLIYTLHFNTEESMFEPMIVAEMSRLTSTVPSRLTLRMRWVEFFLR